MTIINAKIISLQMNYFPRVANATRASQLQPIDCSNIIYNSTNRLKSVLPQPLDDAKSAFIPVVDYILLFHELVKHYGRQQLSPRCLGCKWIGTTAQTFLSVHIIPGSTAASDCHGLICHGEQKFHGGIVGIKKEGFGVVMEPVKDETRVSAMPWCSHEKRIEGQYLENGRGHSHMISFEILLILTINVD
ncbi:hypothetical protein Ancab_009183 [Ancistrocladus abbreviatus]